MQRRRQKVLEEAPSPVMTAELRARMGEAAVKAASGKDHNTGTVEFLLDPDGNFYFYGRIPASRWNIPSLRW